MSSEAECVRDAMCKERNEALRFLLGEKKTNAVVERQQDLVVVLVECGIDQRDAPPVYCYVVVAERANKLDLSHVHPPLGAFAEPRLAARERPP